MKRLPTWSLPWDEMTEMREQAPGFIRGVERVRGGAPMLLHPTDKIDP